MVGRIGATGRASYPGGISSEVAERLIAGARSGESFDVTENITVRMTMAPKPNGAGETPAWTLIRWSGESRNPERAEVRERVWHGRSNAMLEELLQSDVDDFVHGRRLHPNGERAFGDFLNPIQRRENSRALAEARRKMR